VWSERLVRGQLLHHEVYVHIQLELLERFGVPNQKHEKASKRDVKLLLVVDVLTRLYLEDLPVHHVLKVVHLRARLCQASEQRRRQSKETDSSCESSEVGFLHREGRLGEPLTT